MTDATHFTLDGTTAAGSGVGGTWTVPGLQVLAAATLGRGVYTINTSAFSFIPDQTVDENTPSNVIPFTINNPTGASYTLTATSDNQFLVQNSGIVLGGASPGVNRTIQFTPVLNANTPANGVANVTVTISSGGFTYQQSFKITVNFVNQLPTISAIPTQTIFVNTPVTVNFTIGDVETASNTLVVAATSNNQTLIPNANLVLGGSGPNRTLTITPANNQVGSATITISVTDGNFGITNRNFDVQVSTFAVLPLTDDFNRANSAFVGPFWTVNTGPVTLKSAKIDFGAGLGIASLNQLTPAAADIALQSDINVAAGKNLGLVARYNGGLNNLYWGTIINNGATATAEIYKNVAGTWTQLATAPVKGVGAAITGATNAGPIVITSIAHGLSSGDQVTIAGVNGNTAANNTPANGAWTITVLDADHFQLNGSTGNGAYTNGGTWSHTVTLRFEVASDSLKLFYGPNAGALKLVAFANDLSITTPGTAGYRTSSGNVSGDNFVANAINLATPTLPFTDPFNGANGSQLSTNWVNQLGNFAGNGSAIVANAGPAVSVATVYNLNQTNGFAQAEVNVVGANKAAGVVARYSTSGFYNALIINTGSGFAADIYRFTTNPATGAITSVTPITAGAVTVTSAPAQAQATAPPTASAPSASKWSVPP